MVSRRSVQSRLPSFPQTSLELNFEMHNLGPLSLSESQLLLEYPHSLTSCWVSPHHQHVDTSNYCQIASVSRLVITTHEEMPKITRRYFTSCSPQAPHRQRILAPVAGLASRLVELLSFSRRNRRGCLLFTFPPSLVIHGWFEARDSCVLLHFFR